MEMSTVSMSDEMQYAMITYRIRHFHAFDTQFKVLQQRKPKW